MHHIGLPIFIHMLLKQLQLILCPLCSRLLTSPSGHALHGTLSRGMPLKAGAVRLRNSCSNKGIGAAAFAATLPVGHVHLASASRIYANSLPANTQLLPRTVRMWCFKENGSAGKVCIPELSLRDGLYPLGRHLRPGANVLLKRPEECQP